jgi:cysteine synthase A
MSHSQTPLALIGKTPMVRLQRLPMGDGAVVHVKCEGYNPGGSVKDRVALAMIEAAEAAGALTPDSIIVEPTSGNTGIGLALIAAIKGYGCLLVMPDDMSVERRTLLETFGAKILLTPAEEGMYGALELATRIVEEDPRHHMPMQFTNPANPQVHYETTGPEILASLDRIDALVCGVGTGGTLTGVGRALREAHPEVRIVAVEPTGSAVLSGGEPGVHRIQGIGAGFIPEVLDTSLIDEIVAVTDEQAIRTRQLLARREGISACISGGAAVYAAIQVADGLPSDAHVVTIAAGSSERDLSVSQ